MMSESSLNKLIGIFTGYVVGGKPVCPCCGGTSVAVSGFEGLNRRHICEDCGSSTYIDRV